MSKVCPKCGMLNAEDRVVCTNCGTVLPAVAQGTSQGQTVPAPTQAYTAPNQTVPILVPLCAPCCTEPAQEALRRFTDDHQPLNGLAWVASFFGYLGGFFGGNFGMGSSFDVKGVGGRCWGLGGRCWGESCWFCSYFLFI